MLRHSYSLPLRIGVDTYSAHTCRFGIGRVGGPGWIIGVSAVLFGRGLAVYRVSKLDPDAP